MMRLFTACVLSLVLLCGTAPALARQSLVVNSQNGRPLFLYDIYDAGEMFDDDPSDPSVSTWTLSPDHRASLSDAGAYWSALLGSLPQNTQPITITVGTSDDGDDTAAASPNAPNNPAYTILADAILHNTALSGDEAAEITLGKMVAGNENAFYFGPVTVLPDNRDTPHLAVVVLHELGHAMGINSGWESDITRTGDLSRSTLWANHLYDSWGNPIQSQQDIAVRVDTGTPGNDKFYIYQATPSSGEYGHIYFSGDNVRAALNGAVVASTPDGRPLAGYLPILSKEGDGVTDSADFSHIELRNSLMSHQNYRNWGTFMEAELAALQDIGINVNRQSFFGHSLYRDGETGYVVDAGNFAWSQSGYNPTPWAVGLHIYGVDNIVSMRANALSSGFGGVGARVDGWTNTLTIEQGSRIAADGPGGTGLMVAYGKEHVINLNGAVSALGSGGVGARFDFGNNILGNDTEYRGSWIYTGPDTMPDELDGPLVETFNVSGVLSGSAAAVYISENAYVRNINLLPGAAVYGDIVSAWNPDDSRVKKPSSEDGITGLAFGATGLDPGVVSVVHKGDISGPDSLDWSIEGGGIVWGGRADVYNFEQKAQSALLLDPGIANSITSAKDLRFNPGSAVGVQQGWQGYRGLVDVGPRTLLSLSRGDQNGASVAAGSGSFSRGFYDYTFSGLNWANTTTLAMNVDSKVVSTERSGKMAVSGPMHIAMQNPSAGLLGRRQSANFALQKAGAALRPANGPEDFTFERKATMMQTASGPGVRVGNTGIWTSGSFNYTEKRKGESMRIKTPTIMVGADSWVSDDVLLGLAVSTGFARLTSGHADIDGDNISVIPYAGFLLPYDFELQLFGSYGYTDYDQRRRVHGERYSADYNSDTLSAGSTLSRPWDISDSFRLTPFVSYEYIHLDTESYKESAGTYALDVGGGDTDTHRVEAGANLAWYLGGDNYLSFGARYSGLSGDVRSASDVAFLLDSSHESINSKGYSLDRHSLGLDAELGLRLTDELRLSGIYDFLIGEKYTSHQIRLALEYTF